jgi:oligopeptide/dipeptide ABC transporter ATP-binding protein
VTTAPVEARRPPVDEHGEPLLEVRDLVVRYPTGDGDEVTALHGVSLDIRRGETVGLVGESGCGKSTLGRAVLRLVEAASGTVEFAGRDLLALSSGEMRAARRDLQAIFQDPRGSLDPRMRVLDIVAEPLRVHGLADRDERRRRAAAMLADVGLDPSLGDRRPTELSGGQQQRVGIGRALVTEPQLVICDEPVSALDVSVQAQVINLFQDLRARHGVAYLFIAHDLAVVRHLSDRVVVMYLGSIVEQGRAHDVFARPLHPYTQGLLASVLRADRDAPSRLATAQEFVHGDVPSLHDLPPGCAYHTRCPFATEVCRTERPLLEEADGEHADHHAVACHHWRALADVPAAIRAR